MDIILIAGLWLRRSIWDDVATALKTAGHRPIPLALPGVDDATSGATLADRVAAVIAGVDAADRPVVVGHSAACTLAWIVADQRPDSIERVVLVGGFPAADGDTYADFFETVDGMMGFPGWGPFDGPDSADLSNADCERIASGAVPVPEDVSKGIVELNDDRRFDVPTVVVCPEFDPDQARAWIANGDAPELAKTKRVTVVDIDSGHWPMVTRPTELARILAGDIDGS